MSRKLCMPRCATRATELSTDVLSLVAEMIADVEICRMQNVCQNWRLPRSRLEHQWQKRCKQLGLVPSPANMDDTTGQKWTATYKEWVLASAKLASLQLCPSQGRIRNGKEMKETERFTRPNFILSTQRFVILIWAWNSRYPWWLDQTLTRTAQIRVLDTSVPGDPVFENVSTGNYQFDLNNAWTTFSSPDMGECLVSLDHVQGQLNIWNLTRRMKQTQYKLNIQSQRVSALWTDGVHCCVAGWSEGGPSTIALYALPVNGNETNGFQCIWTNTTALKPNEYVVARRGNPHLYVRPSDQQILVITQYEERYCYSSFLKRLDFQTGQVQVSQGLGLPRDASDVLAALDEYHSRILVYGIPPFHCQTHELKTLQRTEHKRWKIDGAILPTASRLPLCRNHQLFLFTHHFVSSDRNDPGIWSWDIQTGKKLGTLLVDQRLATHQRIVVTLYGLYGIDSIFGNSEEHKFFSVALA